MPLMPLQLLQEVLQLPLGPQPGGGQQRSRVPRARATRSVKAKQDTCSRVRGSPSPWTHLLLSTSWWSRGLGFLWQHSGLAAGML